jgi:hypothetical protein
MRLWKTKMHCGNFLLRTYGVVFVSAIRILRGEVTERLKVHDWKSCVLQKSTGGSNPPLSAKTYNASGPN